MYLTQGKHKEFHLGWNVANLSLSTGRSLSIGVCHGDPPLPYGNERAVRILLECILVCKKVCASDLRQLIILKLTEPVVTVCKGKS